MTEFLTVEALQGAVDFYEKLTQGVQAVDAHEALTLAQSALDAQEHFPTLDQQTLQPLYQWDFNQPLGLYATVNNMSVAQGDSTVILTVTGPDPQLILPLPLNRMKKGSVCPIIRIRYCLTGAKAGPQTAAIFAVPFVLDADHSLSLKPGGAAYLKEPAVTYDGQWHVMDVDMSTVPGYGEDYIGALRLDFYDVAPGMVELDYVLVGAYTTETFRRSVAADDRPVSGEVLIKAARRTYGNKDNAILASIIANEPNGEGATGILGDSHLQSLPYSDSVAGYFSNRAVPPLVTWPANAGNTFTATTVTLPNSAGFDRLRVGMIIETLATAPSNKKTRGWVQSWDATAHTITVDAWRTEGLASVTPINGSGLQLNLISKIWALNANVFRGPDSPSTQVAGFELGVINNSAPDEVYYADQENWEGEKLPYTWGYDAVNLGLYRAAVAFIQRGGFLHAFLAAGGSRYAFTALPKDSTAGNAQEDTKRAFNDLSKPEDATLSGLSGPGKFIQLRDGDDLYNLYTVDNDGLPRSARGTSADPLSAALHFEGGYGMIDGETLPVATWDDLLVLMLLPEANVSTSATGVAAGKFAGQRLTVTVQNDKTVTVKTGGNLRLAGTANFVMNPYASLTLLWRGDVWVELSRSST